MTIDLYYMPESPPCRVVELVANQLNIPLNKKYLDLAKGEHLSNEQFVKLNPLHCVPTIVDGDVTLWESRAISTYLVNKYAKEDDSLYPKDLAKRSKVDMMLYYDMGTLNKTQSELLKPKLMGIKELDKEKDVKFQEALKFIDNLVSKSQFVAGDHLSVADISIVVGLTFSEVCDYDLSGFKSLESYRDRVKKSLPTYNSVNAEALARFRAYVQSKQQA